MSDTVLAICRIITGHSTGILAQRAYPTRAEAQTALAALRQQYQGQDAPVAIGVGLVIFPQQRGDRLTYLPETVALRILQEAFSVAPSKANTLLAR